MSTQAYAIRSPGRAALISVNARIGRRQDAAGLMA
jgi:hypothetical protein